MKTAVDLRHFLMARALHYKKVLSEFIQTFRAVVITDRMIFPVR